MTQRSETNKSGVLQARGPRRARLLAAVEATRHHRVTWVCATILLALTPILPAQFRAAPPPPSLTDPAPLPDILERLARAESPEPFIQEIYREVQITPALPQFIGARGASHIYAQPLLGSMYKEFAGSTRAFAGRLDFLPFCSCQDPSNLILSPLTLTIIDPNHTDATLHLHTTPPPTTVAQAEPTDFPAPTQQTPQPTPQPAQPPPQVIPETIITLHLVRTEKGWRVDDVSSARVHSLKLLLRDPPPTP